MPCMCAELPFVCESLSHAAHCFHDKALVQPILPVDTNTTEVFRIPFGTSVHFTVGSPFDETGPIEREREREKIAVNGILEVFAWQWA